jgi:sugar phosphate isomerase/epimerase
VTLIQRTPALWIGLNGRFFPQNWRPATQEIAFAARAGFAAIQFPGPAAGLDHERLGGSIPDIAGALADAGVMAVMEILLLIDHAGRTANGQTPLEVLEANLPAITGLPCRYVHWHLALAERMNAGQVAVLEERMLPELAQAVRIADTHGFVFGLEHNAPASRLFAQPAACASALAATPGLHLVWDFNHTAPDDAPGFVALAPRVSMLHVADTRLPEVNEHLPLGLGTASFVAYLAALAAVRFVGPAILEIGGLPKSGGYGRDTDEALVSSRARLAAMIEVTGTSEAPVTKASSL